MAAPSSSSQASVITGVGGLLALAALFILPANAASGDATEPKIPALRVALICAAVALLSLASVLTGPAIKSAFIVAAIGTFVLTLRIDRAATRALLPSDAFSLRSATGAGLWMVLVAINRLQSACDIRAAVPAAIARTQSTDRWIHGCGSIAGMDGRRAFRRVAYR